MNEKKIILDLCGGTGAWSEPYRQAGYDVRLVTLPEQDVRTYEPPDNVYGILAAPPCTEFAISGAVWWKTKPPELLQDALKIAYRCLEIIELTKPYFWALENPVGRLKKYIGNPVMIFNPCDYGNPWTKKTCLWGNFRPPLKYPVEGKEFIPHKILSSKASQNQINKLVKARYLPENWREVYGDLRDRKTIRSITPPGFAQAFFEVNQ